MLEVISENISIPSGIYTDLAATGTILQSIFHYCNDEEYQFVGKVTWVYSINFKCKTTYRFLFFYFHSSLYANACVMSMPKRRGKGARAKFL